MPAERIDKTNCFKMNEIDQTLFYQMPKLLFSNPLYFPLTNNARVVYSLLRDRMDLSRKNGWCEDDDTIYLLFPLDKIAEIAKISHKTCVNVMKELKKYDLVITRRMGLGKPNRVYIKKCKNYTSYGVKNTLQEVEKIHPNDTDISDTEINDTKRYTETRKQGTHNFEKPTVEEINDYCLERENDVDPEAFFDFYESKGWKVGRNPMKDWKAAVRNWERNDYGQHKKKKKKKSQYDEIDF